jgi:hypothetical protein
VIFFTITLENLDNYRIRGTIIFMKNKLPKTIVQEGLITISANYHSQIPLDAIFSLIKENGGMPVQEDGTEWSGLLCGESSFTDIQVIGIAKVKWLRLAWYKMQSGRYEINAYLP